jgi:hypothetical protein
MAEKWYGAGLRFECTGCGHCCTGAPGYVWVTWEDCRRIAAHLGAPLAEFRRRFVRRVGRRYSLIERANGDCVFWSRDGGCTVYAARPPQCRSFPFWPEHLRSRKAWTAVGGECPGAGQGRFYPIEKIERIRRNQAEASGR